jgi:TetR/AcrR family transcriptional regulator
MVGTDDRRTQILEAAFEEFAAKGYHGATIKGIVAAAGLRSPTLIYWYFPHKEGLFGEVLGSRLPVLRAVEHPESLMKLPPDEVLVRIGLAFLASDQSDAQALRLAVGEAVRRPEVAEMFVRGGPDRVLGFLEAYLGRQIESGNLRHHDARSSARAFLGMLLPQLVSKLLLPMFDEDNLTDEGHLEAITELFLRGLESPGPAQRPEEVPLR